MKPLIPKIVLSVASIWAALFLTIGCRQKTGQYTPSAETKITDEPTLAWNMKTTVAAYEKAGHANPKWDAPAKCALKEFAEMRANNSNAVGEAPRIIGDNCKQALDAGCFDPMIRYLDTRFRPEPDSSAKDYANKFCKIASDMEGSSYPAVRKYYAWRMASVQVLEAYGATNEPPEIDQYGIWSHAEADLLAALPDPKMPPVEDYETSQSYLSMWGGDAKRYADLYQKIMAALPRANTSSAEVLLLQGKANIVMAWHARGNGFANTVSEDSWKLFEQRLLVAENALTNAYRLQTNDVRIDVQMMTVVLGLSQGRDQAELWFNRAMETDPNNYDACNSMLTFLEPKWGGSVTDMLTFARECIQNQTWGGHVPLIMYDAHQSIQSQYIEDSEKDDYWRRPQVWADLKSAFDRFFELNPDETRWYHNYAMYAYKAGQWNDFNDLLPKLGSINYEYFGGQDKFERMVATAKERGNSSKPTPK